MPAFPVDRRLVVHATQVFAMPPAAQYECRLLDAERGDVLAEGTINVAMGG